MAVSMTDGALAMVWSRIEAGDRVRFIHDYFGGHWVEFKPRWFFARRTRVALSAAQILEIKNRLDAGSKVKR